MKDIIFHAHSGLRFLVLLAAVAALAVLAYCWATRRAPDRLSRIATMAFVGLLDLQIVLGLLLIALGVFYPSLMGHLTMMLLAAAAAHGLTVAGRKQTEPRRAHALALAGVVLALVLIAFGIRAIGRGVFGSSGRPTASAAAPAAGGLVSISLTMETAGHG